ncbi:MAG: phosphomethylpyrimidine synthase, partial [Myxococcales bacterium]|nr:phosphomethylpyrimidine synthase [Myxococcales bacterium]
MTDTPTKPTPKRAGKRLNVASDDVQPVRTLPALEESFPRSAKVSVSDLDVPFRRIDLSGGEPSIEVYDTTGPQGVDPRQGLPKRRQAWIDARLA